MSVPTEEDDEIVAQFHSMSLDELLEASRLANSRILALEEKLKRMSTAAQLDPMSLAELLSASRFTKSLIRTLEEKLEMTRNKEEGTPGEASLIGESSLSEEADGNNDPDTQRKGKSVVVKTSERETIDLHVDGTGPADRGKLKAGDDLVGVNEETLPPEYNSVKVMEVDEKPTEDYSDIGGLEKQIQELLEAIVLPLTEKERFQKEGIRPPKGVLLYGPPGTGKTLLARATAARTDATFLKLAGAQLVQSCTADGAKLVRDAFQLAKEKSPCIIFIDEIDAIGSKHFDSELSTGSREIERTMFKELLSQLDGFSSVASIKVIAATNRVGILDPDLMCSGRLDRKIVFPHPSEEARAQILQIHSRKMNVHPDVNFKELAQTTNDFNGAQLKAVCVEAGNVALRREAAEINHGDFNEAVIQVQANKKASS